VRPFCRCLAAMMIAMPLPAVAQGARPDAVNAAPAPLPPRRPASLPRSRPVEPPASVAPSVIQPKTAPAEAARPGGTIESAMPPPPASLSCTVGLSASHGDGISPIDPAKLHAGLETGCHVDEPVLVRRLTLRQGEASETLVLDPPATMACDLAAALARWAQTGLQPLAKGHFSQRITRLRVGGGHECRRRNRSKTGPLSEHATGRALDIFGFVLEGEQIPDVGKRASGAKPSQDTAANTISVERPAGPRQLAFIEAVRQSACGAFMTVLGPGSDAAHANHLHLDIQARRSGASRFCQ